MTMTPRDTTSMTATAAATATATVAAATIITTAAAAVLCLVDSWWKSRRKLEELQLELQLLRQSHNQRQNQRQNSKQLRPRRQHQNQDPHRHRKDNDHTNTKGVDTEQNKNKNKNKIKKNGADVTAFKDGCNVLPIGYVESCYHDIAVTPRQPGLVPSAKAVITLDKSVSPTTLEGLDEHSHIWVVFFFHKNNNPTKILGSTSSSSSSSSGQTPLRQKGYKTKIRVPRNNIVTTKGNNKNDNNNRKVGCLATRTPHRPNPIGLSLGTIEHVCFQKRQITLSGSDLLDGTPVIDIKPYVPVYDNPEILQQRKYDCNDNLNNHKDDENLEASQDNNDNNNNNNSNNQSSSVVRVPYFSDPKSFTRRTVTLADGLEEKFLKTFTTMPSSGGEGTGTSFNTERGLNVFRHDPPSRCLDALVQTFQVDVSRRPNQTRPLKPYLLHFDGLRVEYVVRRSISSSSSSKKQQKLTNVITHPTNKDEENDDENGSDNDNDNDNDGNELPYETHIWSVEVFK